MGTVDPGGGLVGLVAGVVFWERCCCWRAVCMILLKYLLTRGGGKEKKYYDLVGFIQRIVPLGAEIAFFMWHDRGQRL